MRPDEANNDDVVGTRENGSNDYQQETTNALKMVEYATINLSI